MRSTIVRVFTNYQVTNEAEILGRDPLDLESLGIKVIFNRSGRADLALILNTVTEPRWLLVPKGNLVKVLQEPVIKRPLTHLFTYYHSRIFDQVLTHSPNPKDPRQVKSIPYLGSFIDTTQFTHQPFDRKEQLVSIISSTLSILPGHQIRSDFIQNLLIRFPELDLHTFGRGRKQELKSKIDGLEKYRFSIAIENSSTPTYITEKFLDCIIAGSVPLYYGAPDIEEYFPKESYIPFPINDTEKCDQIIRELSDVDFENRKPALEEARLLIRDEYSLSALILTTLKSNDVKPPSRNRIVLLPRLDGLICMVQKLGITKFPMRIIFRK